MVDVKHAAETPARVRVTQTRSATGYRKSVRRTLAGLGLRRIGHSRVHQVTRSLEGALQKVSHLVEVESLPVLVVPAVPPLQLATAEPSRAYEVRDPDGDSLLLRGRIVRAASGRAMRVEWRAEGDSVVVGWRPTVPPATVPMELHSLGDASCNFEWAKNGRIERQTPWRSSRPQALRESADKVTVCALSTEQWTLSYELGFDITKQTHTHASSEITWLARRGSGESAILSSALLATHGESQSALLLDVASELAEPS